MWHWDIPELQRQVRVARKTDADASIEGIFDACATAPRRFRS
jgi:hypothetical protein